MLKTEFEQLRYGNIIRGSAGLLYMVTKVMRDKADEKAVHVAITPALSESEAEHFELVSKDRSVAYITGATIHES